VINCAWCGLPHSRKKFCSGCCKDRYHNKNNPRGYGLARHQPFDAERENELAHEAGMDAAEAGWDGHKGVF